MDRSGAEASELPPILREGVRRAMHDGFGDRISQGRPDFPEGEMLELELVRLARRVGEGAERPDPGGEDGGSEAVWLGSLGLLSRLRRGVLEAWSEEGFDGGKDGHDLLELMHRFQGVEDQLHAAVDAQTGGVPFPPEGRMLLREVAHIIRSPVASLTFMLDALRAGQSGPLTPLQDDQLGMVQRATLRLSTLASDLLALMDTEGRPVPDESSARLADVLQAVREVVEPLAADRDVTFSIAIGAVDAGQLRVIRSLTLTRIILNLCLQFLLAERGGVLGVEISEDGDGGILLRVEAPRAPGSAARPDGSPERILSRDSDGGYSLSPAALGLAVSRELASEMGAGLDQEASPDGGVVFRFTIDSEFIGRISDREP